MIRNYCVVRVSKSKMHKIRANAICHAVSMSKILSVLPPKHEELDNVLLSSLKKEGEIPSFSSLMTPARFLLRALMIRAQSSQLFRHPLLHELHTTRMSTYIKSTREVGLAWRAKQSGCQQEELEPLKTPQERSFVTSNGGASLGNVPSFSVP